MIKLEHVSFSYQKNKDVLSDINLEFKDSKITLILGRNGVGKTTLLNIIMGLLKVKSGKVAINGVDIKNLKRNEIAKKIAYVPQVLSFGAISVFDTVLLGRITSFNIYPKNEDFEKVNEVLNDLGLSTKSNELVENLSGGEQRKVAIARCLVQEPSIIILDEATSMLDLPSELAFLKLIKQIVNERKITVICSMHDINRAYQFGDEFVFLKDNKIMYNESKENLNEELLSNAFDTSIKIAEINNKKIIIEKESL